MSSDGGIGLGLRHLNDDAQRHFLKRPRPSVVRSRFDENVTADFGHQFFAAAQTMMEAQLGTVSLNANYARLARVGVNLMDSLPDTVKIVSRHGNYFWAFSINVEDNL